MRWLLAVIILIMLAYCWTHAEPIVDVPNRTAEKALDLGKATIDKTIETIAETKINGTTIEERSIAFKDTAAVKVQGFFNILIVKCANLVQTLYKRRPNETRESNGASGAGNSLARHQCLPGIHSS